MHGATIKAVSAQQAKLSNNYKNTRPKLLQKTVTLARNKACSLRMIVWSKHVGAFLSVLM